MWLPTKLKEKKTKIMSWFLFLVEIGKVFAKKDLEIGFLTRKTLQNR